MKFCVTTKRHMIEMMDWFPDRESCLIWGGPDFRFPFTESTFFEDAYWAKLPSYSLVGEEGNLIGFGQYYLREGRCHLGRLVISPALRNQGLARVLIAGLMEIGCEALGVDECSLFVLEHNKVAIQCYRRIGFYPAVYPGQMPELEGCLYMVKGPNSEGAHGTS